MTMTMTDNSLLTYKFSGWLYSCCSVVQGIVAAEDETIIPLTVTPMTIGPLQEIVQITIGGVEDTILVKKHSAAS